MDTDQTLRLEVAWHLESGSDLLCKYMFVTNRIIQRTAHNVV